MARATPTSCESRAGPTGTPSRAPAHASLRLSPPTRRSAPATSSAPAPTQLPTATTTIGTGNSSSHEYIRVNAAIRAMPPAWSSSSLMSAPAHSAVVSVVETTSTRSDSSAASSVRIASSEAQRGGVEGVAALRAVEPERSRCHRRVRSGSTSGSWLRESGSRTAAPEAFVTRSTRGDPARLRAARRAPRRGAVPARDVLPAGGRADRAARCATSRSGSCPPSGRSRRRTSRPSGCRSRCAVTASPRPTCCSTASPTSCARATRSWPGCVARRRARTRADGAFGVRGRSERTHRSLHRRRTVRG